MVPLLGSPMQGSVSSTTHPLSSSSSLHPPPQPLAAAATFSSTSTLLKEISTLRLRLKELESEDARSSATSALDPANESELVEMLRKDLATVELEKATMEKEFMNQLSTMTADHLAKMEQLQKKLKQSEAVNRELNKKIIAAGTNSHETAEAERCLRLLEQERESHSTEIEKMKENLAQTDMEIAESRREMDNLEERLFELENEKETLLEENTSLREHNERQDSNAKSLEVQLKLSTDKTILLERTLKSKDEEIQRKQEEIGEMNDALIMLEEHKQLLVTENTDVRVQLAKVEEAISTLRAKVDEMETSNTATPDNSSFDPQEKSRLEESVTDLEARLERLKAKLEAKGKEIESLSASLVEERRVNKELREEVKKIKAGASKNIETGVTIDKGIGMDVKDHLSELSFLRNQNKALNDEIKRLRRRDRTTRSQSPSPAIARTPAISPARGMDGKSPMFSGIVANFERRIATNSGVAPSTPSILTTVHRNTPQESPFAEGHGGHLQHSEEEVRQLESELTKERETVQNLSQQLRIETDRVHDLRAQLESASCSSTVASTGASTMSNTISLPEYERLCDQLNECERAKRKLEQDLLNERDLSEEMRASFDVERKNFDKRILECQRQLDHLSVSQDEKKEEDGNAEEVYRLRTTVRALQPELESAMEEIERLEAQVQELQRGAPKGIENRKNSSNDSETGPLKARIAKLEVEKAQVELELKNKIDDLENEMGVIELAAEEELEEREQDIQKLTEQLAQKEKEIARLEGERTQLCSSMNNVSSSRKDEIDGLQAELVELSAKTSAQAREITSLKLSLENMGGASAVNLKKRIKELEEELKVVNWTSRNQVHKGDIEGLKRENNKLRDCIREVKMERRQLQDRLESMLAERSSSKSSQILRERNDTLKQEVEKLTKRLRKMEESITRFAI